MKRTNKLLTARCSEHGSQLVEFALVLPLLLLISLVIIEGAAMIRTHQLLNNAAREGARLSSLHQNRYPVSCGADCTCDAACVQAQLQGAVIQYAHENGINDLTAGEVTIRQDCQVPPGTTTTIDCNPACGAGGSCLNLSVVTIEHPYTFTYLPRISTLPTSVTLQARAEFRNLY